ncbi:MAG: FHA domain-containing protein [Rubripirellula sp.]
MISQTETSKVTLVATNDFGSTHRYDLESDQGVFVGASANCGLQLHGAELADIQCRIGIEEGKVWVQDWMSKTGTRVNGQEITTKVVVQVGDQIQIGQHTIAVGDSPGTRDGSQESQPSESDRDGDFAEPSNEPTEFAFEAPESSDETIVDGQFVRDEAFQQVYQDDVTDVEVEDPSTSAELMNDFDFEASEDLSEPEVLADEPADFDDDFFDSDDEGETYDKETVALLQAEIEDLQAALAQRDAERFDVVGEAQPSGAVQGAEESDEVLQRMQDLVEEANRSDERVSILEEMLQAAEDANRREHEERQQLEAWVGDIEQRIGQREEEHAAEVEALKNRIEDSDAQHQKLQGKLRKAAVSNGASKEFDESMDELQQQNRHLQFDLAHSRKECTALQQQLDKSSEERETVLREERAKLAKEQAQASRLRYELSTKLAAIEEMPKSENVADQEAAQKIRTLREHLREIHEQEKQEEKEASLATRLSKLWKRVEY